MKGRLLNRIRASIVGFNGTEWGRKCLTGQDLYRAWYRSKIQAKELALLDHAKKNEDFCLELCRKLKGV